MKRHEKIRLLKARTAVFGLLAVAANALAGVPASAETTTVVRKGALPASQGPAANFTGNVTVRGPYRVAGDSRVRGSTVTFEPGARTNWHSHPMGQVLVVTEGCGWTQARGGTIEKICPGDVAWIGPGEEHWHGATSSSAMSHVTASETIEGQNVEWLERVTDEEYARGPR